MEEQLLFQDDPNDFQLMGELIPCKSFEEQERERMEKARIKGEEEQPFLFGDLELSKHQTTWD